MLSATPSAPPPPFGSPDLAAELRRRSDALAASDPLTAARTLVELGIYEERARRDRKRARACYEAARALVPLFGPALLRSRRLVERRADLATALGLLDEEITLAENERRRADLFAERARYGELLGRLTDSREAYTTALRLVPGHAAALRGLETVLRRDLSRAPEMASDAASTLSAHLERLAVAYGKDESNAGKDETLGAWLYVERALLLTKPLGRPDDARTALIQAVNLVPTPGPVRDALSRHLLLYGNYDELVTALLDEPSEEPDDARAARLLLLAACTLIDRLRRPSDALGVLIRAAKRSPEGSPEAHRSLRELLRLQEAAGQTEAAADTLQQLLTFVTESSAIAHEHARLFTLYLSLGQGARAVKHAGQALELNPSDQVTRGQLDRLLDELGRHQERVGVWVFEAHGTGSAATRAAAFFRAADISEQQLGRRDDALAYLRAAWLLAPGDADVFQALSAFLAPTPYEAGSTEERAIQARIDFYQQAVTAAKDPERRIAMLEKLVNLWEDDLGRPDRALEDVERILAIDPHRRSAVLALQRNAARARNFRVLLRALELEAELTADITLRQALLLRAGRTKAETQGDMQEAQRLLERALDLDRRHPGALRAYAQRLGDVGRYDEARQIWCDLVAVTAAAAERFSLWISIAERDELRRKRPDDAVQAYRQAARIRPDHPLPQRELVRLLRGREDFSGLVDALTHLANDTSDPATRAALLLEAADVYDACLGNEDLALKQLVSAEALLVPLGGDVAVWEALERLYVRREARIDLVALYGRWLQHKPAPLVEERLRTALALVLLDHNRKQAVECLQSLLTLCPGHVAALRMLGQLARSSDTPALLVRVLRDEASVGQSRTARAGAWWELVKLEENVGLSGTLEALIRLADEDAEDTAVADATIRVASLLLSETRAADENGGGLDPSIPLLAALRRRREALSDPTAQALLSLEEAHVLEGRPGPDPAAEQGALTCYRRALDACPTSLLAARSLQRLAVRYGDKNNLTVSHLALAQLVEGAPARASHLVRAAELTADEPTGIPRARDLYEEALHLDPDNGSAASVLAKILAPEPARLLDRFAMALEKASDPSQVALLGTSMGQAVLAQHSNAALTQPDQARDLFLATDPAVGIAALERVLRVRPEDPTTLLLAARLFSVARLWSAARDHLLRATKVGRSDPARVDAFFELVALYTDPLRDLALAESTLRGLLALDPSNPRALEWLHKIAVERDDRAVAIEALRRLLDTTADLTNKVSFALRLAETYQEAGETANAIATLLETILLAPTDLRSWRALGSAFRAETTEGAAAYAQALEELLRLAAAREVPVEPRWLTTLGLLEATVLLRGTEAIQHLRAATALPGALPDTRVALGQGLEATGRNGEAISVLRDVLTGDRSTFARSKQLPAALAALESALAKEGRVEERSIVEEVRVCLGHVPSDRAMVMRRRPLVVTGPPGMLAVTDLPRILVAEAKSPLLEIAMALATLSAKILRFELAAQGNVSSRDRIGPRDGHPTRQLAERLARSFGIDAFELYLVPNWPGPLRLLPGDVPTLIGPDIFADLPELEQGFALAHSFARAFLGMVWLDNVQIDAIDGLFLAALRVAMPVFGEGELSVLRERTAQGFSGAVQKHLGRRQRRIIEDAALRLPAAFDTRVFAAAIRSSEYRLAHVLTGAVVSAVDYLRRCDRDLDRVTVEPKLLLEHSLVNDLLRYVLTAEAHRERTQLASTD